MALSSKSLFLYGFQITPLNSSIDFRVVALETPRQATLRTGFYSLSSLCTEIVRALQEFDSIDSFSATVDRTVSGGLENRVTISSSSGFFQILFGSGPRASSAVAPLIGFNAVDYTGATSYTGSTSAGTLLITNMTGYNYIQPELYQKSFGNLNISAAGVKEAVVFQIQKFFQVQFKYIPKASAIGEWQTLNSWITQQKEVDFTPEVSNPSLVYNCTLETSSADGMGLSFMMREMLPDFPNLYDTGLMKFRLKE